MMTRTSVAVLLLVGTLAGSEALANEDVMGGGSHRPASGETEKLIQLVSICPMPVSLTLRYVTRSGVGRNSWNLAAQADMATGISAVSVEQAECSTAGGGLCRTEIVSRASGFVVSVDCR